MGKNCSINTRGEKVNWNQIKIFRFEKCHPESEFYKNNFDDEEFCEIKIKEKTRSPQKPVADICLAQAFQSPPPITTMH